MDREGARGGAFGRGAGTAEHTFERMRALRRESECYGGGVARAADDAGGGAARSGAAHAISRAFAGAGIAIARAALADCVAGQRSFVAVRRGDRALRLARAGMAGHHRGRSEIVVADEFW